MTKSHGYGPYSRGCRCDICREAKRLRQQQLRQPWREALYDHLATGSRDRHVVPGIAHGYGGYTNFYCRCPVCTQGKRSVDIGRNKKTPGQAVTPTSP